LQTHHDLIQPIAVETLGPNNESATSFLYDLGRRISLESGEDREPQCFCFSAFQSLSIMASPPVLYGLTAMEREVSSRATNHVPPLPLLLPVLCPWARRRNCFSVLTQTARPHTTAFSSLSELQSAPA